MEAERLVLRGPDSANYADIELAGRHQLRFRVFANVRGTPRPPTDTLVAASPGAGLDLVAGVNPALVLTTGDGTEVIRLERGVRPVGRQGHPCGPTDLARFFAVATEVSFGRPRKLRVEHLDLQEQACMFYRQDPERWRRRRRDYPGLGNPFIGGLLGSPYHR